MGLPLDSKGLPCVWKISENGRSQYQPKSCSRCTGCNKAKELCARSADVVAMEDTLDKARQLRDEMVRGCLQPAGSPARHIQKIYPEADSEALPDAVEALLGACSGSCLQRK